MNQQQYTPVNYQQDMLALQHAQQQQAPQYERQPDTIETYGSIIKDLTDTETMLLDFELRLRGKVRNAQGEIETKGTAFITTDDAARDYVNLIRSIVNRHTDFSFYETKEVYGMINGAAEVISEWLMYQADTVPKGYRMKIGFEGMAFIKASLHKAMNGRMLTWTKGAISENTSFNHGAQQKKGLMDYIWPFGRRKMGAN